VLFLFVDQEDAPMNNPTALPISIRGLTKKYGDLNALNSVDLEIKSSEFLTLLGPSGSGKTTLLMAIAGFNRPDAGSIKFGDAEMVLTPPHKRDVGMVFQSYALFPHMTVSENIGFPLKLRGLAAKEARGRVDEALATVQLSGLGDRAIDQLSGGQRQRVALARAFVFRPRILLMDEPLSALDKKLREHMQIELKQIHRQLGVTTVYVTHDQREALTMSDRIAVINHGELAQVDTPEAIYNRPKDQFVADFIGESTMLSLTRGGDGRLSFGSEIISSSSPNPSVSKWSLVVRPERLHLLERDVNTSEKQVVFRGHVKEYVFQGETGFALIALNDMTILSVRFGTGARSRIRLLELGALVSIGLMREDIILIPEEGQM
jgi:putative spermidine/putrescine transport system ATP-binding protein